MDILVDLAIQNIIVVNGEIMQKPDLAYILQKYKDTHYNVFIISHPGSYVGIRKALVMSIVQLYTNNLNIYTLNVMEYMSQYGRVACIVQKHIWYKDNDTEIVVPTSAFNKQIDVCNAIIYDHCNYKIVNLSKLWNIRYQVFKKCSHICYPIYLNTP